MPLEATPDAVIDLRLPLAVALDGELLEDNSRLADVDPLCPDRRHRAMTPAQRALAGVYFIRERVPAWEGRVKAAVQNKARKSDVFNKAVADAGRGHLAGAGAPAVRAKQS